MAKRDISIRLAVNDDAEAIGRLVNDAGHHCPYVVWENVAGCWVVAEKGGKVVGAIQTLLGRPIAFLEMLSVADDLIPLDKGFVTRELLLNGLAMLRQQGAQQVRGFVPFDAKAYKKALKKRGAIALDQGNLMVRRVV